MDAAEVRLRRQIEVDQRLGRQANLSEDYRTLSHIYRSRQQVNEAELWVGKAVEIANRTMEQAKMADDYRELCDLSMATKRFDRAQQYLWKAMQMDHEPTARPIDCSVFSVICETRGQAAKAERWLQKAFDTARRLSLDDPGWNLTTYGQVCIRRRQFRAAELWLREAIRIYEEVQDKSSVASCYRSLSKLYREMERFGPAAVWQLRYIRLTERLKERRDFAAEYSHLSRLYKSAGRLDDAEFWLSKALAADAVATSGDRMGLVSDYCDLSEICRARGQLHEAELWMCKAIEQDEQLRDDSALGIDAYHLSTVYRDRDRSIAEYWLRKQVENDERLGAKQNLARDYDELGYLYKKGERLDEAALWAREAISVSEQCGDDKANLAAYCYTLSGICAWAEQEQEEVWWLRKAIAIGKEAQVPIVSCYCDNLSGIYERRGDLAEAEVWTREAISVEETIGNEESVALFLGQLSDLYQQAGQFEEAERTSRRSIDINQVLGNDNLQNYLDMSRICRAQRKLNDAERWLRLAIQLAEKRNSGLFGREDCLAWCYEESAEVYSAGGDFRKAEARIGEAIALVGREGVPSRHLSELRTKRAGFRKKLVAATHSESTAIVER